MAIRLSLSRWIADLDAASYVELFPGSRIGRPLAPVRDRFADYFVALVAELFDLLRAQAASQPDDWSALGNALADLAAGTDEAAQVGISRDDPALFGATAFVFGGFPASAFMVAQTLSRDAIRSDAERACAELLLKPAALTSPTASRLVEAIRVGDMAAIDALQIQTANDAAAALTAGPKKWIPATLLERLVDRLASRNVRAVLPDGASDLWQPLVASLLARRPPIWEYFPSQMEAIRGGLLTSTDSFSLQMPTGAGKTALTETLLYYHARTQPDSAAALIVPYRSLASELRRSMVRRLNAIGVRAMSLYGGSVPTADEVRDLDRVSTVVATPETLSGLLGANESLYRRLSLVVCDEGHLLDSGGRGVALELLLARLRGRETGSPRFVFVSAITPNVEEINTWLGGTAETVVVSDYRPALAEFAFLHDVLAPSDSVDLVMHPEMEEPSRFAIHRFLKQDDFRWQNPQTGRPNTYSWGTVKVRAIATARKAMRLGPVAVFTTTKTGNQGAIALARELVNQLRIPLTLPTPLTFADRNEVDRAHEYLALEYGQDWTGTEAISVGAALHHGDIPQETREVLEQLVRTSAVPIVVCTNTLAEGVNLPIRTLVLYTTRRRTPSGQVLPLLTRDIKNLVGRAGRPGASTKGLVVCANEGEWPLVRRVALQQGTEPVHGALLELLLRLQRAVARQPRQLTNLALEGTPELRPLVDGIDATLIDLVAEEVGEGELVTIARRVASETFAFEQADPDASATLERVFELRAARVSEARENGRIGWVRRTGARLRHVDAVVEGLMVARPEWDGVVDPLDPTLVRAILGWAWDQSDVREAVRTAYRLDDDQEIRTVRAPFMDHVNAWLRGERIVGIAASTGRPVDEVVQIQTQAVTYALQTIIEQGVALLEVALEAVGRPFSPAVSVFVEHLRYGVPTRHALRLSTEGLRHRSAAVALGQALVVRGTDALRAEPIAPEALAELDDNPELWRQQLGSLVIENTRSDLVAPVGRAGRPE